jgi:predicted nucleic acid-binding protein
VTVVYVESNFPLEIALGQEQAGAAEEMLEMAESRVLEISIPTFAISEPFSTLAYRRIDRRRIADPLQSQINLLRRSHMHQEVASLVDSAGRALLEVERLETRNLASVMLRIVEGCTILPLTRVVYERAMRFVATYDLSAQDAIVYATIIADLETRDVGEAKCFASRDKAAFIDPGISTELEAFGCRYVGRFDHARDYLRSVVTSQ